MGNGAVRVPAMDHDKEEYAVYAFRMLDYRISTDNSPAGGVAWPLQATLKTASD